MIEAFLLLTICVHLVVIGYLLGRIKSLLERINGQ